MQYFDGLPDSPGKLARSFAAASHRIMFIGHLHKWLLATPEGVVAWRGDRPVCLDHPNRYLVVIDAVWAGKYSLFDTKTSCLTPFGETEML